MRELTALRQEIDQLDSQIAQLFLQRMEVCREVGEYKKANGLPVLDPQREQELLSAKSALSGDPDAKRALRALFETVMSESRTLQSGLMEDPEKEKAFAGYLELVHWDGPALSEQRVLYQGLPGAYCEEAAIRFFGEKCNRMNLKTWDGVFRGVKEGFGDYGVVPIENSSTGSISDVYDLLGQFGCHIVGEQLVRVDQCLLALPGANMGTITDVYTHEQGFRQCRSFLASYPKWGQHEMVNTALAARFVSESGDKSKAAIASRRAAELYDLDILQTSINENRNNYTRFIIVAADPRYPAGADTISVRFTLPHVGGSLCRMLQIFARAGLNLEKLESRPIPEESWSYSFYADFTGNLQQGDLDPVIRELINESSSFRILGNYKAASL